MIHDLEKIDNSNLNINYDICIVGAGAAGITLANKLSGKGLKVILCEAGSKEYTEVSQKNYAGKIIVKKIKNPLNIYDTFKYLTK